MLFLILYFQSLFLALHYSALPFLRLGPDVLPTIEVEKVQTDKSQWACPRRTRKLVNSTATSAFPNPVSGSVNKRKTLKQRPGCAVS